MLPPSHCGRNHHPRYPDHRTLYSSDDSNPIAATEQGITAGFFPQAFEHALLAINASTPLRTDGTYGVADVGQRPVPFSSLRESTLDRRYLPFVQHGGFVRAPARFELHAHQWRPTPPGLTAMNTAVREVLIDLNHITEHVRRDPPPYVLHVVQHTLPIDTLASSLPNDDPYPGQLLPWFTAEAKRQRLVRIWRMVAIGRAAIDAYRMEYGEEPGTPVSDMVGVVWDGGEAPSGSDLYVVHAYRRFGVPVHGLPPNTPPLPDTFSIMHASRTLFGPAISENPSALSPYVAPAQEHDPEHLEFDEIFPDYDRTLYEQTGRRWTSNEMKEGAGYEEDMIDDDEEYPFTFRAAAQNELAGPDDNTTMVDGAASTIVTAVPVIAQVPASPQSPEHDELASDADGDKEPEPSQTPADDSMSARLQPSAPKPSTSPSREASPMDTDSSQKFFEPSSGAERRSEHSKRRPKGGRDGRKSKRGPGHPTARSTQFKQKGKPVTIPPPSQGRPSRRRGTNAPRPLPPRPNAPLPPPSLALTLRPAPTSVVDVRLDVSAHSADAIEQHANEMESRLHEYGRHGHPGEMGEWWSEVRRLRAAVAAKREASRRSRNAAANVVQGSMRRLMITAANAPGEVRQYDALQIPDFADLERLPSNATPAPPNLHRGLPPPSGPRQQQSYEPARRPSMYPPARTSGSSYYPPRSTNMPPSGRRTYGNYADLPRQDHPRPYSREQDLRGYGASEFRYDPREHSPRQTRRAPHWQERFAEDIEWDSRDGHEPREGEAGPSRWREDGAGAQAGPSGSRWGASSDAGWEGTRNDEHDADVEDESNQRQSRRSKGKRPARKS